MCKNWTFFCLLVHEISKENEDITLFILSNLYLNVYLYQIYIIEIMLWNCCIKLLICLKKRLQTEITEYCPLQESLNGNTFQNPDNISVFFFSSLHDISFVQHSCAYFSQINESAFEQIISVQPCQARYKWDHTTFIDLVLLDIFYISVLYIMQKKKKKNSSNACKTTSIG